MPAAHVHIDLRTGRGCSKQLRRQGRAIDPGSYTYDVIAPMDFNGCAAEYVLRYPQNCSGVMLTFRDLLLAGF